MGHLSTPKRATFVLLFPYKFFRITEASIRMKKLQNPVLSVYDGIRELFPIAVPIFLSQAIDVLMIFCDRYFLSQLGKEDLAATLSGGILLFLFSTLILGTLGQITSLVGQYKGAGEMQNGVRTVHQGMLLSLTVGICLVFLSQSFAPKIFTFFGHELGLLEKETEYYSVLAYSIVLVSLRTSFSSFFIGVERTKIVTLASFSAVVLNIPLTYVLVFGKFGFPKLGIEGAALGTVISGLLPIVILGTKFYSKEFQNKFQTNLMPKYNGEILKKLLRYGLPSGIETTANVAGFMFFTMVMYSYSGDVAAATTIVLNWDMVCFVPLLGIGQAVSGQVGKYLGEGKKDFALRSAYSALTLGWVYSILITFIYFTQNYQLVILFSPEGNSVSFEMVVFYATRMLQISCLYFLFDSTYNILGGILKGSGDTVWPMFVSNAMMWTCASLVYIVKNHFGLGPFTSWWVLTGMVFGLGVLYLVRFLKGNWLERLMIRS